MYVHIISTQVSLNRIRTENDNKLQVLVVVAGELRISYFPQTAQPLYRHL